MMHRTSLLGSVAIGCMLLNGPVFSQDIAEPAPQRLEPLNAQTGLPSCGGAGNVVWIGGDEQNSDVAVADAPLVQQVAVSGALPSVFAFGNTADLQDIRIEAQSGDGDPVIVLSSAEGDYIDENDDTPESLNSRIEHSVGPGVFCVTLENIRAEEMSATIQVSRTDQSPLLNETSLDATSESATVACTPETEALPFSDLPLNEALAQGGVAAVQDGTATGYFRFTLDEHTPLTLRATSRDLDPYMTLYDGFGSIVGENDDADGLNARLDYAAGLEPGDYCVGIRAYSAAAGEIEFSAEVLDRETVLRQSYERGELVPPADGGYPVETIDLAQTRHTVLLNTGKAQWLRFEIASHSVVIVNAYGSLVGADTKLALFSPNGAVIGENDDGDNGVDSKLGPIQLAPGSYMLAVSDLNSMENTGTTLRPLGVLFDLYTRVE